MDTTCSTHVASTEKRFFHPLNCKQRDDRLKIKYKPDCLNIHVSKLVKTGMSQFVTSIRRSLSYLHKFYSMQCFNIANNSVRVMWNEVLVVYFKRAAQDFVEGNEKIKTNVRQEIPFLGLNSKFLLPK